MSRAAHTRNRSLTLTRTTLLAGRPSTCWQRRLITRHLFGGFMSRVLVVDAQRQPLHPCTPARARLLLKQRKAAVLRRFPFVLILKETRPETLGQELRVKIDPGSKTTGLAIVNETTGEVLWAAELTHRGEEVREALTKRRAARRSRRSRRTRYRQPRFTNRRRPKGWLPPSLRSRSDNVLTWVARLRRWCPVGALSLELVKFDTALMQDASLQPLQPAERQPVPRGILGRQTDGPPPYPGAPENAPGRRSGHQHFAVGFVRRAASNWSPTGDGQRWQNQMESGEQGVT